MPSPETLNLEALLAPIPGKNPGGQDVQYDGKTYNEIESKRLADDENLPQGDYKRPLKRADWPGVIKLASETLEQKSKDLQVAAWLTEAMVQRYGFAGFRDGLKLLRGLQERFWESLYPRIPEDGDLGYRSKPLGWLNKQLPWIVKSVGLTKQPGTPSYSCLQWEYTWNPNAGVPDKMKISEQEFNKAAAATPLLHCQTLLEDLAQCEEEFGLLNQLIEEKFGKDDPPDLTTLKEAIDLCHKVLGPMVKKKGGVVQDPGPMGHKPEEPEPGPSGGIIPSDRNDALRRLSGVAEFFRRTEPHSPVAYLVQRAVRWGEMPLERWLQEVISDDAALSHVRETLGLKETQSEAGKSGTGGE